MDSTLGIITSPRTISMSSRSFTSLPRCRPSERSVPERPRMRLTASSTESGRVGSPSMERMASPSLSPPFSAGLSGNTRTAIRSPSRRPMRAPIPESFPSKRILKSSLPRPEKTVV